MIGEIYAEEGDDHRLFSTKFNERASIWRLRLNKLRDFALLLIHLVYISRRELASYVRAFNKQTNSRDLNGLSDRQHASARARA